MCGLSQIVNCMPANNDAVMMQAHPKQDQLGKTQWSDHVIIAALHGHANTLSGPVQAKISILSYLFSQGLRRA